MNGDRLFKAFCDKGGTYGLYEDLKEIIESEVREAEVRLSLQHYDFLISLMDSENNAGWEERHSERISLIQKRINYLYDKYGDYM